MQACELKSEVSESYAAKKQRVESTIDALALTKCRNTLVGTSMARGISGGQLKRTNIGLALVTSPAILFLDEPTSGLDSYTANEVRRGRGRGRAGAQEASARVLTPFPSTTLNTPQVMDVVARITAARGITVCATIHSPSPYSFQLFDRLYMLVGGRTIYFGPNGEAAESFFTKTLGAPPAAEASSTGHVLSPAEWMTDVVVGADRKGLAIEYADAYTKVCVWIGRGVGGASGESPRPPPSGGSSSSSSSPAHTAPLTQSDVTAGNDSMLEGLLEEQRGKGTSPEVERMLKVKRATVTPSWFGLKTLLKYRARADFKDPTYLGPRIADKLIVALLQMTLYWGIGDNTEVSNVPVRRGGGGGWRASDRARLSSAPARCHR